MLMLNSSNSIDQLHYRGPTNRRRRTGLVLCDIRPTGNGRILERRREVLDIAPLEISIFRGPCLPRRRHGSTPVEVRRYGVQGLADLAWFAGERVPLICPIQPLELTSHRHTGEYHAPFTECPFSYLPSSTSSVIPVRSLILLASCFASLLIVNTGQKQPMHNS